MGRGGSAVRLAREAKLSTDGGGDVSPILSTSTTVFQVEGLHTYQQPPGASRRSNTQMRSRAFSWAKASTAMTPAGPAPMTAILLTAMINMIATYFP